MIREISKAIAAPLTKAIKQRIDWLQGVVGEDTLLQLAGDEKVSVKDAGFPARITKIRHENGQCVTVSFELMEGYRFRFKSGQFVRVVVDLGGGLYRRCYSLSSPAENDIHTLTIKQHFQGRVSSYFNGKAKTGDLFYIDEPAGEFVLPKIKPYEQRYGFIAAGSGIVPVWSLIQDVLGKAPEADIHLIYINQSSGNAIFKKNLDSLVKRSPNFTIDYIFTRKNGKKRDRRHTSGQVLVRKIPMPLERELYICAPSGIVSSVLEAYDKVGVSDQDVRVELYTGASSVTDDADLKPRVVSFVRPGLFSRPRHIRQRKVETILETAKHAGVVIDQKCTVGTCQTCKIRLASGTVIMDEPNTLTLQDAEKGVILACVAYPCESVVVKLP